MDRWQGPATLEWWADWLTCLGGFGVRVTAHVTGSDWVCEAVLDPPLAENEREGFDLLMARDPLCTLRFDTESTLLVNVTAVDDERLSLSACEAKPVQRVESGQAQQ